MRSFALPRILLPTVAVAALVAAGCSAAPTDTGTGAGGATPG